MGWGRGGDLSQREGEGGRGGPGVGPRGADQLHPKLEDEGQHSESDVTSKFTRVEGSSPMWRG